MVSGMYLGLYLLLGLFTKLGGIYLALHGTPDTLGVLWPQFSYSRAVFRQFSVGAPQMRCVQSASSYFWMLHC